MFYHRQQVLNNTNFHIASRGGFSNNHPGNKASRELARRYATAYNATKKSDRPAFARQLYHQCLKDQRVFVIERDYFLRRFVQDKTDDENPAPRRKGGRRKLSAERTLSIVRANGGDINNIRSLPSNVFISTGDVFAVGSFDHLLRDEARKVRECAMGNTTHHLQARQMNNNVFEVNNDPVPLGLSLIRQVSGGIMECDQPSCDLLDVPAAPQQLLSTKKTTDGWRLEGRTTSTANLSPLLCRKTFKSNDQNISPFVNYNHPVNNNNKSVKREGPSSRFLQFVNNELAGKSQWLEECGKNGRGGGIEISKQYRSAFLSHSCSSLFDSSEDAESSNIFPSSYLPPIKDDRTLSLRLESLDESSFATLLPKETSAAKNGSGNDFYEPLPLTHVSRFFANKGPPMVIDCESLWACLDE